VELVERGIDDIPLEELPLSPDLPAKKLFGAGL